MAGAGVVTGPGHTVTPEILSMNSLLINSSNDELEYAFPSPPAMAVEKMYQKGL